MTDDDGFAILESANETESRDQSNYYVSEYLSLFRDKNGLKQKALKGELRNCRFRSLCWRLFLDDSADEPNQRIRDARAVYESIREKYETDPRVKSDDNPLSQDASSKWHRYFSDSELRTRIGQDVIRTFPEIDFFQIPHVQTLMVNVLFHYAREHARIDYKQGMHELLAPLLFVIHCDEQTFLHATEIGLIPYGDSLETFSQLFSLFSDSTVSDDIRDILNPQFIEHDAYHVFSHVMEAVEPWYLNDSLHPKSSINAEPFSQQLNLCSFLGVKLQMISEQIVKRFDSELYSHLLGMEIAPQIFGIRWMRLLFGREFPMEDLLVVWDAIFADGFAIVDYIFASMLIVIRTLILHSDYADCLSHLMRYPNVPDIHHIIDLALHMRDPVNHPEPIGSYTVMPNNSVERPQPSTAVERPNSLRIKSTVVMETDIHTKIEYCWKHMTLHLDSLQKSLADQKHLQNEDSVLIALAELKKVRDILKGTLKLQ